MLNYIDENIYSAFLAADSRNMLNLLGNFLNCTDIERFIWLLRQKDKLESRVTDARCNDGSYFWDLEYYEPLCTVNFPHDITCETDQSLNLTEEFRIISSTLPENQKHFLQFNIRGNPIFTEIPQNVFIDITFDQIMIDNAPNLTSIHTNAFNNTANITSRFWLPTSTDTQLVNNPPDYDLWAAMSSLVNASYIIVSLDSRTSQSIPENNKTSQNKKFLINHVSVQNTIIFLKKVV
jgi:hypothetical protein